MKSQFMPKRIILILLIVSQLTMTLVGCSASESKGGFSVILADTGESLLTESDIKAYHADTNSLELNTSGISKWNSQLIYQDAPKLEDSMFGREFIIEIEGKEVGRGKLWSNASSSTFLGLVILDALGRLDNANNTLWIQSGYPNTGTLPPTISSELIRYFEKQDKIK
ncbi:MAG: hypothetical protein P3T54_05350 [Dehalogenimonas sp.]|uniref:Uncharacterized protein n=1 Tax=Candidatus Dehalogenimonas loeffleri TaxID=3127115 RepID=A0ABZ2J5S9_9CHLR|nr:hypothetical protein [Dehalogenimonas sp.]